MYDVQNLVMSQEEWEEICGPLLTEEEVLMRLKEYPEVYREYQKLTDELQKEFLTFSMGVRGAKMTYDPFFKYIFDPEVYLDNVEGLLSACFGEKVQILEMLPNESKRITEDSSLLIADMLVRLQSGVIVNVEIQRVGYYFPGPRCACYSSDLVMRQYMQIKEQCRRNKTRFTYNAVRKVYTIILMQESTGEFHKFPNDYVHSGKQTFDTGLKLDLLQEYILIPLDIFLKIQHNEISELDAWLYFIASDNVEDIKRICTVYPRFRKLYRDVFRFRFNPRELVSMFSDALRILDEGTVQYMIDDMKRMVEERDAKLEEQGVKLEEQGAKLKEKDAMLEQHRAEIEALKAQIAALKEK